MKVYILSYLVFISFLVQEGEPRVKEIKDKAIVDILGSLVSNNTYSTEEFFLRLFKKENPNGSAGNESGEITHSYYFIISDADDFPKQTLFEIGEFYAPEIIDVKINEDHIRIRIGYFFNFQKVSKDYLVYHHRVVE